MANKNKFRIRLRKTLAAALASLMIFQFTGCASVMDLQGQTSSDISVSSSSASAAVLGLSPHSEKVSSGVSSAASAASTYASSATLVKQTAKTNVKTDVKTISVSNDSFSPQTVQQKTITRNIAAAQSYSYVSPKDGYNSLKTQLQRTLYDLINEGVYKISSSKSENGYYLAGDIYLIGKLSESQIVTTIQAFFDDNPQVFWITNSYSYAYNGNSTYFRMYSYLSANDCNSAISTLNSKIQAAVEAMPSGLSEFDREEYIFDYIVKNCSYDNAAVADQTGRWQSFTVYGALSGGTAVCEGYSKAMQLLCSYAGIKCMVTEGTASNVRHMWNAVDIDGSWYYLDVTWCDGNFVIYNYFNIPESVLKKTHIIAPLASSLTESQIEAGNQFNLSLPQCNSTKENYYNVKGIKVSNTDSSGDSAVVSSIESGLKSGQTAFTFLVSGSGGYDAEVKNLLESKPYKINTYFYEALQACGYVPQNSKISYVEDKDNSGLNIKVALS